MFVFVFVCLLLLGQTASRIIQDTFREGRQEDCEQGEVCVNLERCRDKCQEVEEGFWMLSLQQRKLFHEKRCESSAGYMNICCQERFIEDSPVCDIFQPKEPSLPQTGGPQTLDPGICGRVLNNLDERIFGGTDVAGPGAWPWIARLLYPANDEDPLITFCGGALISVKHVITAAHCVENPRLGNPVAVMLGELDITSEYERLDGEKVSSHEEGERCLKMKECSKAIRYEVGKVITHPDYSMKGSNNRRNSVFDIAILELNTLLVEFTKFIQPICLPSLDTDIRPSYDFPDQPLVLTGWGNTVGGLQTSNTAHVLQQLTGVKEVVLNDTGTETGCRTLLGSVADLEEQHMCVFQRGSNGCEGDSGGPVARINRKDVYDNGVWELAGVVSFGASRSCGAQTPLVVTRVGEESINRWVRNIVGISRLPTVDRGD